MTAGTNPKSPAQVGNGEFAFGVDITGLQIFVPFNTFSQWSWHCFPLPAGQRIEDFKGVALDTHGRKVIYSIPNKEQTELSGWLAGNPHRYIKNFRQYRKSMVCMLRMKVLTVCGQNLHSNIPALPALSECSLAKG